MKSFRFIRKLKIAYLFFGLLSSFLMGFIGFFLFYTMQPVHSFTNYVQSPSLYTLFLLILSPFFYLAVLLMAFAVFWLWNFFYATCKARLIFDEQGLRLEGPQRFSFLLPFSVKSFALPFDQIRQVRSIGGVGLLEILDEQGKIFKLLPGAYGENNGEHVLRELRDKVPAERFETGAEIPVTFPKWSKTNTVMLALIIVWALAFFSTFAFDPRTSSRAWFVKAWQVRADPGGSDYEDVWAYSKDPSNTFWVAGWRSDYYRIYHFTDRIEQEWKLPKSLLGKHYPEAVSSDKTGNPIVWFDDKVFHYENGNWQAIPYENNLRHSVDIVSGEQGWMIACYTESCDADSVHLLKIDALTGKWSTLPLPGTAIEQKLAPDSLHWIADDRLLVFMRNNASGRAYILSNDRWDVREYPVILTEKGAMRGCFLDRKNFLWVLLQLGDEFIVEKVDPSGNYRLTELPVPAEKDQRFGFNSIIVDATGRLWISGDYPYFMAVFTPVWKGQALEIVHYTRDNSNFQGALQTPPVLLFNGQIWSFGRLITTINTNQPVLPAPLPGWFAAWDWNSIRMGFSLAQIPLAIANYILTNRRRSPKRDKAKV